MKYFIFGVVILTLLNSVTVFAIDPSSVFYQTATVDVHGEVTNPIEKTEKADIPSVLVKKVAFEKKVKSSHTKDKLLPSLGEGKENYFILLLLMIISLIVLRCLDKETDDSCI